ncbi:Cation efflux protein [Macrophomina phaseolina MS6]|uniref:Cation efflux protein n=2 Tax=Macrophomina phaseolina TaxID=35725 RepID=K2R7C6_MACPH|nr:Cation efflux protein [Macrophomina phaseolina MS6]KAH7065328.1 putative cation efflux family protein [Macrophomina phaseolina]
MSATQTRSHAGHSHGHGHGHHHHHTDPALLLSKDKNDAAVRITRLGLYLNVVLAVGKGIAGYYWNSKMLIGDAFHSLSDMASDIMTLLTVKWALRPPSERYPTGFGKIECLGSLGVSSILLLGGLGIGWSAVLTLSQMFAPELADALSHFDFLGLGHGHDHGDHGHSHSAIQMAQAVPSLNAAWMLIASAGVKEWLVYATRKVARERKSSVLFSNAMHHRIDSFTAILTAVIIMASNFATNAAWLDPVGSLIITGMVVKAGYENLFQAFSELIDVSIDDDIKSSVRRATSKALADAGFYSEHADTNAVTIRNVAGLKSGPNYLLELELAVPADWTIAQTNGVEDLVRERIGAKVRGAKRVKVRFVAADKDRDGPDFLDEFIASDVSAKSSPGEPDELGHDHHHDEHVHERKTNGGVTKRR